MKESTIVAILMFLLTSPLACCIKVVPGNSQSQLITIPDDFSTIQEGISYAEPGSTIYVRNGTYIEHLTVNKPLTIIGENMLATIINATVNPIGIYVSADFVTIANFTITALNLDCGIELERSRHCTLTQNLIETLGDGISLFSSNENTIAYNTLSMQYHAHGIELYDDSRDNVIVGNRAVWNDVGLKVYGGCRNFVASNTFGAALASGIIIDGSDENTLVKNDIYGVSGLVLANSQDTRVFTNSIRGLTEGWGENVVLDNVLGTSWDAGYPQGGNCWYGYNGSDVFQGPYQNESGNDGIGDTPYVIDAQNIDHYPLMQAPSLGSRDIGIANIILSKQVLGGQTRANITIKIVNFQDEEVTTIVTVYGNSTILDAFNATLPGRTVSPFKLVWNTTDLADVNYDISVLADIVENETYIADNVLAYGTVHFGVPGDVNADGVVDIFDAIILAGLFDEDSFSPNWNMNVDFNGDEVIDIYDALILASNFG